MKIPAVRRVDWQEVRRLRVEERLPAVEIAAQLDCAPSTVRHILHRLGVRIRRPTFDPSDAAARRLYSMWHNVSQMCRNPNNPRYAAHGGRGIDVVPEWESFRGFRAWASRTRYAPGLTLVRRDLRGSFGPKNCAWRPLHAVRREHLRRNSRRGPGRLITAFGESKSVVAWARDRRCKVSLTTLRCRLGIGVPPEAALSLPPWSNRPLPAKGNRKRNHRRKARTRVDWDEILRLHVEEGFSARQTGLALGISPGYVVRELRKRGSYRPRKPLRDWSEHAERLHVIWRSLPGRCKEVLASRTDRRFSRSGRAFRVCREWRTFRPFHDWAVASGYRPGLHLVCKEGQSTYSPSNCLWLARGDERFPHRPPKRPQPTRWTFRAFGETKGPTAWSRDPRCEVSLTALLKRLRNGWHPESALTHPPRARGTTDHPTRLVEAFGRTRGITAWSRDRRCKVSLATLTARLDRGIPPEQAIATPPYGRFSSTSASPGAPRAGHGRRKRRG